MQFLGKFGKIVCWRPSPPGEILDPPLVLILTLTLGVNGAIEINVSLSSINVCGDADARCECSHRTPSDGVGVWDVKKTWVEFSDGC